MRDYRAWEVMHTKGLQECQRETLMPFGGELDGLAGPARARHAGETGEDAFTGRRVA